MGVYIRGMEMPRECDLCEIWSLCWAEMPFWEDRREDCPLVEVKAPHGDLIDRDKAIDGAKVDGAWSALAYEPPVIKSEVE